MIIKLNSVQLHMQLPSGSELDNDVIMDDMEVQTEPNFDGQYDEYVRHV